MAKTDRPPFTPGPQTAGIRAPSPSPVSPPTLTLRAVLAYQAFDRLSGVLICFMIVFSPWAFGTTQNWSIWVMNVTAYLLGMALAAKLFIRRQCGHRPARWNGESTIPSAPQPSRNQTSLLTQSLAAMSFAILGYCLVAALNARSTYNPARMDFTFHSYVTWLPHSYARDHTWRSFANYLALAFFFWSSRDWLLGKTSGEIRAAHSGHPVSGQRSFLPGRLRWLLWLLAINGALLAAEGIPQRLEGSGKLLWLVRPRINSEAEYQFGPYAYRATAAQYFNLLWPVVLGFWWTLRREVRHRLDHKTARQTWRPHSLLLCVLLMAMCPIL